MLKLSEQEIITRITTRQCFECEIFDGSFYIKIDSYTPSICTAIHAGNKLRETLINKCELSIRERRYEEDPYTDALIQAMPITLIARDSRYEYDLNRPIAHCIYNVAWDKKVWRKNLTQKEQQVSINKHQTFYRILDALINEIEKLFGAAMIFDIHAYNYLRRVDESPTFNIGTAQINLFKWQSIIEQTLNKLSNIELPNMPVTVAENAVFKGRGYMIAHVNSRFQHSLVLPLEIKKVYMDELSGEVYPLVMQALNQHFKTALVEISTFFSRRFTTKKRAKKSDMLAERMDPAVLSVDSDLFKLAHKLDTLHYINPVNIASEQKRFLKHQGNYQPKFRYRQLNIDPYQFREKLYRLPVNAIRDPTIQSLYRDVINALSDKVGLLANAGKPGFLYESLKYYGEPTVTDKKNAQFLLHAQFLDTAKNTDEKITTEDLLNKMSSMSAKWNMSCKIEAHGNLVASAMVSSSRKAVMIAKNLSLTPLEANALIHHELGVHMATTLNAATQKLKVFSLGLPGNTLSQEGLAILNEYISGNISLERLKGLALRVLAVSEMLNRGDFCHTYRYLLEEHKMTSNKAFNLAVRVHRGGGFTKDYLYLSGVSKALDLYQNSNIKNMFIGKTAFEYLPLIDELVERQLATPPVHFPVYIDKPVEVTPVMDYLMTCIRPSTRTGLYENHHKTQAA